MNLQDNLALNTKSTMNKVYYALLAIIMSSSAFCQVIITSLDFPKGKDTVVVSNSLDFEFDYQTAGADFTWDYSSLIYNGQRIDTFFDINSASLTYQLVFNNGFFDKPYQADYFTHFLSFSLPSLDLVDLTIEDPVIFTKVESSAVETVGVGLRINGIEVPVKAKVKDIEYKLPMSYGDDWISNSFLEIDLNPIYDGVLRRRQERKSTVDGWGVVQTPFGTYNAIRVKSELNFTDSLKVLFGGASFWIELPTPNQIVYSWFSKGQKNPVLQVVEEEVLEIRTVISVEYKDKYRGFANVVALENESKYGLFPNPTREFLQVSGLIESSNYQVFDVSGKIIQQGMLDLMSPSIFVGGFEKGFYMLSIGANENKALRFEIQ